MKTATGARNPNFQKRIILCCTIPYYNTYSMYVPSAVNRMYVQYVLLWRRSHHINPIHQPPRFGRTSHSGARTDKTYECRCPLLQYNTTRSQLPLSQKRITSRLCASLVVSGLLLLVVVGFRIPTNTRADDISCQTLHPETMSGEGSTPAFSLLVHLQFKDVEKVRFFLEIFAPVADYVKKNEPDTILYRALLSDKDPLHVLVVERYRDKENAYLRVHKSSEPFLKFRPKLRQMEKEGKVTITGHSYLDANLE